MHYLCHGGFLSGAPGFLKFPYVLLKVFQGFLNGIKVMLDFL